MGIIHAIGAAIQIIRWILREKKEMEANVDAYLTRDRAKLWRENTEKIFKALASGNGNIEKLPKPIRWFFGATTADNRVGWFGMWYLKSTKLEKNDPVLEEPVKPYPAH